MHQGKRSEEWGLKGIPGSAEYSIIKRDIQIAGKTGGKLHVAHISTKEAVDLIRQAKEDGVNITCDPEIHEIVHCKIVSAFS